MSERDPGQLHAALGKFVHIADAIFHECEKYASTPEGKEAIHDSGEIFAACVMLYHLGMAIVDAREGNWDKCSADTLEMSQAGLIAATGGLLGLALSLHDLVPELRDAAGGHGITTKEAEEAYLTATSQYIADLLFEHVHRGDVPDVRVVGAQDQPKTQESNHLYETFHSHILPHELAHLNGMIRMPEVVVTTVHSGHASHHGPSEKQFTGHQTAELSHLGLSLIAGHHSANDFGHSLLSDAMAGIAAAQNEHFWLGGTTDKGLTELYAGQHYVFDVAHCHMADIPIEHIAIVPIPGHDMILPVGGTSDDIGGLGAPIHDPLLPPHT